MIEEKTIKESDLENVSGGNSYVICGQIQLVKNLDDCVKGKTVRPGYCKYCKNWKDVIYVGTAEGWGNIHPEWCAIWECTECHGNNYFSLAHGNLI